jgi:small subunit ribosomal protein S1
MKEYLENNADVDIPTATAPRELAQDFVEPDADIDILPKTEQKNASVPVESFDWETFETEDEIYGGNKKEVGESYMKTLSKVATGEVVEGTIVSFDKREAIVNIGYKSEGVINIMEFRYNPDLKPGDKVEVYVENTEDKYGQLQLSHRRARDLRAWDRVNQALANDEIIKGYIKSRTKGGMIVDVFGVEAFLPGSQIDVKPIRDWDIFVGKTMEFKVVKINTDFHNVVISHKVLIEHELEAQRAEIIAKLEKGQVLEGSVKNITTYGVFIDLGGIDGLIHITDLAWGRVSHPEEIVQLDQKLNVVILDFDDAKKRIALGLKQLTPHPWEIYNPDLKVGDVVHGKVVVVTDYGAFVEVFPGLEGLVHVSEMSWSQHIHNAQDFLKVGDEVDVVVLSFDRSERKMAMGIKQLKPDPWEDIETRYPISSKQTVKVRNFTTFGIFVELEEGIDGLVHISDLSWTKKIKHPSEVTQIGADLEVVILDIDKAARRLSLGHKQLEDNPWDVFETVFTLDSVHEGTIIEVFEKGAIVSLQYGVEGFVSLKNMQKEDGTTARLDEKLPFKIVEFNRNTKRIVVSHLRVWDISAKDEETVAREEAAATEQALRTLQETNKQHEKTTLGDMADLEAFKADLVKSEE